MNPGGRKSNGMQKLYTKILHKIEDFPAKVLHEKLHKAPSVTNCKIDAESFSGLTKTSTSCSMPQLPGIQTLKMMDPVQQHRQGGDEDDQTKKPPERPLRRSKLNRKYENVELINGKMNVVIEPVVVVKPRKDESDQEDDINVLHDKDTILSLEDEIFQELEKAANDEEKLNAALKNFDKILSDFSANGNEYPKSAVSRAIPKQQEEEEEKTVNDVTKNNNAIKSNALEHRALAPSISCSAAIVAHQDEAPSAASIIARQADGELTIGNNKPLKLKSKIPLPQQVLMKSKTCSIIESRCILKKSRSGEAVAHSVDNLLKDGKSSLNLGDILLTKSLWSLGELDNFAKSSQVGQQKSHCVDDRELLLMMERTGKKMDKNDGKNNYKTYKIKGPSSVSREQAKRDALDGNGSNKKHHNLKKELKQQLSEPSYLVVKTPEKQKLVRTKSQLPRAKSVWELSLSQSNGPRTSTSGSRIPVKQGSFSRAVSTINLCTPRSQSQSHHQLSVQKRSVNCDSSKSVADGKKLSASLSTLNNGGMPTTTTMTVANKTVVVNSSCNKLAIGKLSQSKHGGDRRQLNGSVSVAELSKCNDMMMFPAARRAAKDEEQQPQQLQKGINLQLLASSANDMTFGQRESDFFSATSNKSNKCPEKGPTAAKKVESSGTYSKNSADSKMSLRKLSNSNQSMGATGKQTKNSINNKLRDVYLPQELILNSRNEGTKTSANNGSKNNALPLPEHNNGALVTSGCNTTIVKQRKEAKDQHKHTSRIGKKLAEKDETDNVKRTTTTTPLKIEIPKPVSINFAKTKCVSNPKLESCKIIPANPFNGEVQKGDFNLKQVPVKEVLNSSYTSLIDDPVSSDKKVSDREYQSDYSDDSGHISNENEDMLNTNGSGGGGVGPGKISEELLKKFETTSGGVSPESKLITNNTINIKQHLKNEAVANMFTFAPKSEVFFRCGVLGQLEAKRDDLLSDRVIQLQARCRGYLARKRLSQRQVQELAVRCIQRNVKAFLAVRDWPWWRLLVRVTPLLNVHRTEEQLKAANEELQALRTKLEKIEVDRSTLKCENEKLESKLSEMTCDLQEERSTSNMTTERLEAEVSERLKLEKELEDQQKKVKDLQDTTDKLEMELICAKSDLNGISEDEDGENENGENGGGVYKLKYERVARELEFTKRRLQTQHQHDLEQLVGLKKQLEKKLADAYEEVEEQRQVVSQWKRKTQKMTNEMNDLRLMLEEQNSRNNVLEKKQRKFDSECQSLRDASRQEKMAKERLVQEKEVLVAEKFTLEQNLADTKMELEIKEEKLISMQRELEELSFAGGTEEEVAQLKRTKLDFERKNKEQEEELDELAGQVQMLEQSKLRLEMTLETMRKEARREAQQRDDEMEEVRGSSYKKIKALECQLESEHEERTLLLREKHELERRLANLEEQDRADRANEEAINHKLRRDLRKYKALLKDSQTQLERLKADSPNKAVIRQIKNQLEDAETARSIAIKARQTAESELSTLQQMYEDSQRSRSDAEEKATKGARERIELQAQIEENEEEIAELMKKFTSTVKQLNQEQSANSDYEIKISELELERNSLKEQIAELSARIENVENMNDPAVSLSSKRLELRIKELESRLELELATKSRIEVQCNRNKETIEKLQQEIHGIQHKELQSQDALKKSQKSLREMREEFHVVSNREQENMTRRKDLEKRLETAESEAISLKNDLRLALQRIADLQQAMEEGDSDHSDSDINESSDNSLSDFDLRPSPMKNRLTGITKNGLDSNLMLKDGKGESRPRAKKVSNASMASSSSELSSNNPHIGDSSYA